jgi:hypothetical protein
MTVTADAPLNSATKRCFSPNGKSSDTLIRAKGVFEECARRSEVSLQMPSHRILLCRPRASRLDSRDENAMKPDDPRLKKAQKEMFERIDKMDKLTIAMLRSHLLAEQCMNDYIVASGVKRKWLRKNTFWDKMQKCKMLAKEENKDPLWDVLEAANQLRNTIAHTLSMDKVADKMAQLKEKYLASLTKEQAAGEKDQPDDFIAQSACVICAGFIGMLKLRAGGEKSAEAT